jgi:hypothetical protein
MAESLTDLLAREYEYLLGREGGDFFLAIESYDEALGQKRPMRRALKRLRKDLRQATKRYVDEQNEFVAEAKRIRFELAARAPEIDNSNMERPDYRTHDYMVWELDSFAGFDDLVERDATLQIGYPAVPSDRDDPGIVSRLVQILRGRLRAAEYGEDASSNDPRIRDDLGDLGTRMGNLVRGYEHALTRYRQEARTLPGLAIARLIYFGSDLNPEPPVIETDEDAERWLDKTLREWGKPKTSVRKLVNGEQMEDWERRSAAETEQFLKGELDRLHQELTRRVARGPGAIVRFLRDEWVVALGSAIIGGLVVA